MQQLVVGQGLEEFDQVVLLGFGQTKGSQDASFVGVIRFAAGGIMIDDFLKRGYAAVMHVRRRERDVPERGRSKLADVFGTHRMLIDAAVRRQVFRHAGVEETTRSSVAVGILTFKSDRAEVPAPWHWKQPARSLEENRISPRLAESEIADMSPPHRYRSYGDLTETMERSNTAIALVMF